MSEPEYPVKIIKSVHIPMRDGINLGAFLILPDSEEKFPAIVDINPYQKDDVPHTRAMRRAEFYFAERGYVMVMVDIRGTGASEGSSLSMWDPVEQDDGYDVVEWVARQPWCDGNVGMWGSSYGGNMALFTAAKQPLHLKAIIAMHCADNNYLAQYRGGTLRPFLYGTYGPERTCRNFAPPNPIINSDKWIEIWKHRIENNIPWSIPFIENHIYNEHWIERSLNDIGYEKVKCPTFMIDGWHDWHATPALRIFSNIDAPKKAIIGPWSHFGGSGGYSGPPPDMAIPGPGIDYLRECKRWFDKWLKGIETGILDEPPLTIFVRKYTKPKTFQPTLNGYYRYETEWPLARTEEIQFYLHDGGLLLREQNLSENQFDEHEYDPTIGTTREPLGGQSEFRTPLDQRPDEINSLVYTSPPLEEDMEMTGIATAVLHVSSTTDVTLFLVKLCDVDIDGTSALVTHEKINATHMSSHKNPTPLEPGKIYELKLNLKANSYLFEKGHRIRVVISSSDIPECWPTPNLCTNRVYHGNVYSSRIILPIASAQDPPLQEPNILSSNLKKYTEAEWKGFVDKPAFLVTKDILRETITISTRNEGHRAIDEETSLRSKGGWSLTIPKNNPANTYMKAFAEYTIMTSPCEIKIITQALTIGSPNKYHHIVEVEGRINDRPHFNKTWEISIPRQLS